MKQLNASDLLVFAPVEEADVPLVNAALIMMSVAKSLDALQLLRMALVVNSSEPFTHFSLGNAWSSLESYQQAIQEYTTALNLDPNLKEALETLGKVKCYLKATENGGPKDSENGEPYDDNNAPSSISVTQLDDGPLQGTDGSTPITDGNIQRESRTICYHVDGKEQCQVEVRTREYIPNEGGENHPCHIDGAAGPDGDPRCQVKVQGPPQDSSGDGAEGIPHQVHQRKVVNISGKQPGKITVNLKQVPSSGTIPSSAYGPHIPSVPAPDVDIFKLLEANHLSWPSPEECQHFKRLNLRAFYSTWLAVTAKNIKIEDHIDFSSSLPGEILLPECPQDFPSSLHTMDHLDGMKRREHLDYAAEQGLREVLQNINGDSISTQEAGSRIAMALKNNPESWVVSNMAALYWRVEGSAARALDCLRHALHYSPNDQKDIALISTANVYHRAGLLEDGITVAKMAVDIAPTLVINHFTLANLYSAKGLFDKAIDLYESSLRLQSEFQPAVERLKTIQCNILQIAEKEGKFPARSEN